MAPGTLKSFSYHIRMPVRRCWRMHLPAVIVRIRDCFHAGGVPVVGYSYAFAVVSTYSGDLLHFEVVVVAAVDSVDEDADDDDDCCYY